MKPRRRISALLTGLMLAGLSSASAQPAPPPGKAATLSRDCPHAAKIHAWHASYDARPGGRLYLPPDRRAHLW